MRKTLNLGEDIAVEAAEATSDDQPPSTLAFDPLPQASLRSSGNLRVDSNDALGWFVLPS